jgi:hypothetical protein
MSKPRLEALIARLEKGRQKSNEIFQLEPEQWQEVVYAEPYPWTVRDLLAHFLSAEEGMLRIAQDVVHGGEGAPEGFDYEAFNAEEQQRLAGRTPAQLLEQLNAARQTTLDWMRTLEKEDLDRVGRHPALGQINLETLLTAIYGHQLLHVRDLRGVIKSS